MENTKAIQIIKTIKTNISEGINNIEDIVAKLQELREYARLENRPAVVKSLRLVCEHLEENGDFLIAIPSDEAIEDEETLLHEEVKHADSLDYLLSLFLDLENKHNLSDIKWYNKQMQN